MEKADIVINTVDCNQIYFDIIEYACEKNKLVICPFDPGFNGLVILFTKESASVYDIFDVNPATKLDDIEILR